MINKAQDNASGKRIAIFTISSNNYMPYTNTLLDSSNLVHPDIDHFLCLVDDLLPVERYYPSDTRVVAAADLRIPDFKGFCFRYDIMELNTAVKPYMFLWLFACGYEQVIYFDPDIKLYQRIYSVLDALNSGASAVLTPHITMPAEIDTPPDDISIMRAGIYNLGFAAFTRRDDVVAVMRWWARRLRYQCINAQGDGIFVDQKFIDLVPGFLPDVAVLRDTSINAAYWNLLQRDLELSSDGWTMDGSPLTFFHFSGFDPRNSTKLSKHTELFADHLSPALEALLQDYQSDLFRHGLTETPRANYAFDRFVTDAKIPTFARHIFREDFLTWDGDPFQTFENYLHQKAVDTAAAKEGIACSNLLFRLWTDSDYLRSTYDVNNPDGIKELFHWFVRHSQSSGVDHRLIAPAVDRVSSARRKRVIGSDVLPEDQGVDVSVIGYLTTDTGVGEAGRLNLISLGSTGRKVEGYDVGLNVISSRSNETCSALLAPTAKGRVQVFNINADQLPLVQAQLSRDLRQDSYRIAVPFWELSDFPTEWAKAFDAVDEIWAPTKFIQASLITRVDRPVLHMPLVLEFPNPTDVSRSLFGLDDNKFVFLFSFDFLSFSGRKNPIAVVRSFKLAFEGRSYRKDVVLVIKCVNSRFLPAAMDLLRSELSGDLDVRILDQELSRDQMLSLIALSDCVVSLHRSEGLGLLVAEAMVMGVPVISTDYSATTELVSMQTGYPVEFKLVSLKAGDYPFGEGQVWAEPDLSHAAWQMRFVIEQARSNTDLVARARQHLQSEFGRQTVCQLQEARLREIGL